MKIKIYIKHAWKKLFLPSNGPFEISKDLRDFKRIMRQSKIRKEKTLQASIYDLSEMD
jgi:hypothetical protein